MKNQFVVAVLLGCMLASASPAIAQSVRWASPEGNVALTVPQDWQYSTEVVSRDGIEGEIVLSVARRSRTSEPRDAIFCLVGRRPLETKSDYVVRKLEAIARDEAVVPGVVEYTVASIDAVIEGTPVLDFEQMTRGPYADGSVDSWRLYRTFPLDTEGRSFEYLITCNKPREISQATLTEIRAFMNSLEINPR